MNQEPQLETNRGFLAGLPECVRQTGGWRLIPMVVMLALCGVFLLPGGPGTAFAYARF